MSSNEPTPDQIELLRQLIRSVTSENSHTEYDKALRQFSGKQAFQAALHAVELEIQQHLALIAHWNHLATR